MKISNEIKIKVALSHGYSSNVLGTSWEYAMMLTHRTKAQLLLYEEVIFELEKLLNEAKSRAESEGK